MRLKTLILGTLNVLLVVLGLLLFLATLAMVFGGCYRQLDADDAEEREVNAENAAALIGKVRGVTCLHAYTIDEPSKCQAIMQDGIMAEITCRTGCEITYVRRYEPMRCPACAPCTTGGKFPRDLRQAEDAAAP